MSNALPGPDHVVPPARLSAVVADAGRVRIAGKGVQDQDGVGLGRVQFAIGFVGDIDGRKSHAAIQGQGIETNDLGFDDHSAVISYCASSAEASSSFIRKARNARGDVLRLLVRFLPSLRLRGFPYSR